MCNLEYDPLIKKGVIHSSKDATHSKKECNPFMNMTQYTRHRKSATHSTDQMLRLSMFAFVADLYSPLALNSGHVELPGAQTHPSRDFPC